MGKFSPLLFSPSQDCGFFIKNGRDLRGSDGVLKQAPCPAILSIMKNKEEV